MQAVVVGVNLQYPTGTEQRQLLQTCILHLHLRESERALPQFLLRFH